jgi:Flp pilus assembly protein TadG
VLRHTGRRQLLTMRRRPSSRGDRGSSAIELSIVAPVVVLLIFSTVQFALWLYGRNVALAAAREGVSQLRLAARAAGPAAEDSTETKVKGYATQVGGQSLLHPAVRARYNPTSGRVVVTVKGDVVTLVPGWTFTVTRQATGEIERFEGDTGDAAGPGDVP